MVVGIGTIVFGVLVIGVAIAIAIFAVDWKAVQARRAERKKLDSVHRDAEQGG
jgi:hypothetical protein